jgi:DNA-binding transcriptional regulator YiaG
LLPGISVSLSATKPEILADRGESIGAHLRHARKACGLKQIEAAALMGVCHHSVVDWEAGTKQPTDRQYPAILAFLGYEPWPKPQMLPAQLAAERRRRGLSAKAAAKLIGVDEGTCARWEADRTMPLDRATGAVATFLNARL